MSVFLEVVCCVCGLREQVFGEECEEAMECESVDGGECCAVEIDD